MNHATKRVCAFWDAYTPRYITISYEALARVADALAEKIPQAPDWKIDEVFPDDNKAFVSQLLYLNAINFGFSLFNPPHEKFTIEETYPGINVRIAGSSAAAACFYRYFGEEPANAEEMCEITESLEKTRDFFQGINELPLLELRRKNLHEVSRAMIESDPMQLLKDADWRAFPREGPGVVALLIIKFPHAYGQDRKVTEYKKKKWDLPFLKRAQLFALMYQGRAMHSDGELPLLRDPETIGPISDYRVPNGLRHLKILKYSKELRAKIDHQKIISAGSAEETEIRAATIYAMRKLMELINEKRKARNVSRWTMVELDNHIWSIGRKADFYHHLTPTANY